jgi:hypothetical protein
MRVELADYDPSIAPAGLAAIWFVSWSANNPDLARSQSIAPLIDHATRDLANGRWHRAPHEAQGFEMVWLRWPA